MARTLQVCVRFPCQESAGSTGSPLRERPDGFPAVRLRAPALRCGSGALRLSGLSAPLSA